MIGTSIENELDDWIDFTVAVLRRPDGCCL